MAREPQRTARRRDPSLSVLPVELEVRLRESTDRDGGRRVRDVRIADVLADGGGTLINPTPIESAVGDFVCKACELPGEATRSDAQIGKCTRCRRGTARRLTMTAALMRDIERACEEMNSGYQDKIMGPDAKPKAKAKAAGAGMVLDAKGPTFGAKRG